MICGREDQEGAKSAERLVLIWYQEKEFKVYSKQVHPWHSKRHDGGRDIWSALSLGEGTYILMSLFAAGR